MRAASLVAQSEIEGLCRGWEQHTVFRLANGDAWEVTAPRSRQWFAHDPLVRIWRFRAGYMLEIEGANEVLPVRRKQPAN